MTKPQLIAESTRLGETPPSSWTVLERTARLEEIKEEKGIPKKVRGKPATPLNMWMLRLNQSSSKKAQLQAFVANQLQLNITGNETMQQLQRMAVQKIYMDTEPTGEDPVGFGQHAALSYQELKESQQEYATWVVKTWKEGDCDYRLSRLAQWLDAKGEATSSQMGYPPAPPPKSPPKVNAESFAMVSSAGSSQASPTKSELQTQGLVLQLTEAVKSLQSELELLKEEKPRKKDKQGNEMDAQNEVP